MTSVDWRYDDGKMELRQQALNVLMSRFGSSSHTNPDGSSKYSPKTIYECAHDWVSQGNVSTSGIVKYYQAYYSP